MKECSLKYRQLSLMNAEVIKSYYSLTKPGIIYSNLLAAAAGFLFGSLGHVNILVFFATLLGTALVIAAACVFNNYIDRGIDKKMKRTAKRALVVKSISVNNALAFGSILVVLGFG